MPYAVLQTEVVRPIREQLVSAFESIERLTHYDAVRRAKGAAGIIAQKLEHDEAMALMRGLASQGIAAAVVDEATLPQLDQSYGTRRIDATPEQLTCYDALDRPMDFAWSEVEMIAAGALVKQRRKYGVEVLVTDPNPHVVGDEVYVEFGGGYVDTDHHIGLLKMPGSRPWIEFDLDTVRYHPAVGPDQLGGPECLFAILNDLASHATGALLNRGVEEVLHAQPLPRYPTRASLERELIWLLWLIERV